MSKHHIKMPNNQKMSSYWKVRTVYTYNSQIYLVCKDDKKSQETAGPNYFFGFPMWKNAYLNNAERKYRLHLKTPAPPNVSFWGE
jgi:hypothetical protein